MLILISHLINYGRTSFSTTNIKSSYIICIRTTDNGVPNLPYDKQFTISILNENEISNRFNT